MIVQHLGPKPPAQPNRVRITAWAYTLIMVGFVLACGLGFVMDARAAGPVIFDEITGHTPNSNYYDITVPIETIASADRTGLYTEDDAEVGSMSARIRFIGAEDTCTLQGFKFRIYGATPAYADSAASDLVLTKDAWTTVNREFSGTLYEIQAIESWKYDITGESPAGCWSANSYEHARWGVAADYYGGADTYFYGGAATDMDALVAFYKPELTISNVLSVRASTTLALTWTTSVATDTYIRWGTTTDYLNGEIWSDDLETSHTETIMALAPNSTVYWEICAATAYPADYTEVCYDSSSLTTPPATTLATAPDCNLWGGVWDEPDAGDGAACIWSWLVYAVKPTAAISDEFFVLSSQLATAKSLTYLLGPIAAAADGLADPMDCPIGDLEIDMTAGDLTVDVCAELAVAQTWWAGDDAQAAFGAVGAVIVLGFAVGVILLIFV